MDRMVENIYSTLNAKIQLPNSEISNHLLTRLDSTVKVRCTTSQPVKILQLYGLSESISITKSTGQKARQPERLARSKVGEKNVCRNLNFTFENTLRSVSKGNNNNIVQAECGKSQPGRVSHLPGSSAKVNIKKCDASTSKKRQPERLTRNKKNISTQVEDENHAPNINKKSNIGEKNVCRSLNSAFKHTVQAKLDVNKNKTQQFGNIHRTMRKSCLIPPGTIKNVLIKKRLEEAKIISQITDRSTVLESSALRQRAQHLSKVSENNKPFMSRVDVQSHPEQLASKDAYNSVFFSDKENISDNNAISGPYNLEDISSMSLLKEIDKRAHVCLPTEQSDITQRAGLEVNVKTLKNTNCKVCIEDTNPTVLLHYLKHYIHNIDEYVTKLKLLLPHLEEIEYSNTSNKIVPGIVPQCTETVDKEIQVNSCCRNLDMDNAWMATNYLNIHIPDIVNSPININSLDNHCENSGSEKKIKDDKDNLNNKCDLEKPHQNCTPESLENKSVTNDSFLKLENDLCITQNNSDSPCNLNTLARETECPEDCTQAFKHYMALKSSMHILETPKCLTKKLPVSDTKITDKSRISCRVLKALEHLYME